MKSSLVLRAGISAMVAAASTVLSVSAHAQVQCQAQIDEAMTLQGQPTLSPKTHALTNGRGDWFPLTSTGALDQLQAMTDADRAMISSNYELVRKTLIATVAKLPREADMFLLEQVREEYVAPAHYADQTSLEAVTQQIGKMEASELRVMAGVINRNFGPDYCADLSQFAKIREMRQKLANLKATCSGTCSPETDAYVASQEKFLNETEVKSKARVQECQALSPFVASNVETIRVAIGKLEAAPGAAILPMSEFKSAKKEEAFKACIRDYKARPDYPKKQREYDLLKKQKEALSATCPIGSPNFKTCDAIVDELREKMQKLFADSDCRASYANARPNEGRIDFERPGLLQIRATKPSPVTNHVESVILDLKTCQFSERPYEGGEILHPTVVSLLKSRYECKWINAFSGDPRACAGLEAAGKK